MLQINSVGWKNPLPIKKKEKSRKITTFLFPIAHLPQKWVELGDVPWRQLSPLSVFPVWCINRLSNQSTVSEQQTVNDYWNLDCSWIPYSCFSNSEFIITQKKNIVYFPSDCHNCHLPESRWWITTVDFLIVERWERPLSERQTIASALYHYIDFVLVLNVESPVPLVGNLQFSSFTETWLLQSLNFALNPSVVFLESGQVQVSRIASFSANENQQR